MLDRRAQLVLLASVVVLAAVVGLWLAFSDGPAQSVVPGPVDMTANAAGPTQTNAAPTTAPAEAPVRAEAPPPIRGRVVVDGGAPLPGVSVTAGTQSALTDSLGMFELRGGAAHESEVLADLAGYDIYRAEEGAARPDAFLNFIAHPAMHVDIVVRLHDGSIAPEAMISSRKEGARGHVALSFKAPRERLYLSEGLWKVQASMGKYAEYGSGEMSVQVREAPFGQKIELRLALTGGVIKGRVLPPEGFNGLPALTVALESILDGAQTATDVQTATGPNFGFSKLPRGTYRLVVRGSRRKELASQQVHVAADITDLEVRLAAPDRADCIVARVTGPDGQRPGDLKFGFGFGAPEIISSRDYEPMQAADGSYWFERAAALVDSNHVGAEAVFYVVFTSSSLGRKSVRYGYEDRYDIDVRFEKAASVEVTVTNVDRYPYMTHLSWSLRAPPPELAQGTFPARDLTPGTETLMFSGVQPMEYDLVLSYFRPGQSMTELTRTRILVVAGNNRFSQEIPQTFTLTVVVGRHAHGPLQLAFADRPVHVLNSMAVLNGKAQAGPLAAGTYRLFDLKGEVVFRMTSDLEVRFEPPAYDALRVEGVRPGSKAEALGFRNADLVVTINGNEITEAAIAPVAMRMPDPRDETSETKVTVLRAGARMEIKYTPAQLAAVLYGDGTRGGERLEFIPAYRQPPG